MTTTAIPVSHVYVSADRYEWSHGKLPRGEGSWGFFIGRGYRTDQLYWAPFGSYGSAKKAAQEFAAARGVNYISVAP